MKHITVQDVKGALDKGAPCILLDVRTPGEFARGKIQGAINIPVDEISHRIEQTIPEKDSTIYVYCLSASRSPIAVEIMERMGYTRVFNMSHGLLAWRIYKFPMVA